MAEYGKIEGKSFLITGAASGLGAGYVEPFLKEGAKAVAMLDIAEEKGKALAAKLNQVYPGKVVFIKCDISSEESIAAAFNEVVDKFGTIDVLINNAGILNDSPEWWRKSTEVNYAGLVSFTLKGIGHMRVYDGGKGGTIINVASDLGFYRRPVTPIYCGTKAGVIHFSQSIAMDTFFQTTGVRVLTKCYGPTSTPLLDNLEATAYDKNASKVLGVPARDVSTFQKPESAVDGLVEMFKHGSHGTIWYTRGDKPVEDITSVINYAYDYIQQKLS